jgi:flagellar protein FliS
MIKTDEYVLRITNATPLQLVIINFEIIEDYINEAKTVRDDEKKFSFNVQKAREFLREMKLSLNMEYEISRTFRSLYNYVDTLLAKFLFNKSDDTSNEALKILSELRGAWQEVKEEDAKPVMENVQQLYAGLTYGRHGELNEYVDTGSNRGFKA